MAMTPDKHLHFILYMQEFRLRPVGGEAEALLDRVYTQTAKATQCSALFFVRASLELQLNRLQDAHQSVAAIGQLLGDIPPLLAAPF